jgi:hypothetical protein
MKKFHLFHFILIFGFSAVAKANFSGSDNLSGNTVDSGKWGADFLLSPGSVGVFTPTGQNLAFSTSGTPTSQDGVVHPWIANFGSYTQNWSLQLDVNIPQLTLASGQEISMGLAVLNSADSSDVMTMNFQQDPLVPNSIFVSGLDTALNSTTYEQRTVSQITSASVRISWDAAAQALTTSYNEGGGWTNLTTQNITSSGTNNWGMNGSSTFEAAIVGFSTNRSVSVADQVYAANFQVVPEPSAAALAGWGGLALLSLSGRFRR